MKPTTNRPDPAIAGVMASLALCMLLPSLATSSANVALPTLAATFAAPFQQVQWIVIAYLLGTTTLIVSAGRLGDIIGRRRLLLAGIALFTVASGLSGSADRLDFLIAARAAQGVGAALMLALTLAFVGEAIPKSRTGRAMGFLGTLSALGTALGPSLGGLLIAQFGWPAIFLVNLPLGVLALTLAWHYIPADRARDAASGARFDTVGTLLLSVTLAAYALALTLGRGELGALNLLLVAVAAIGLALFIVTQKRSTSPLIRLERLRESRLRAGLSVSALVATVMMATLIVAPFYLTTSLGLSTAHVGLAMSAGPLIAALVGIPAGRLVDRFGAERMARTGLAGLIAGSTALSLTPAVLGIAGYLLPSVVLTGGYAIFQTANNTGVMKNVAADQRGVISGLLNLSRNLGLITGASVLGAVFSVAMRAGEATSSRAAAVATGMHVTFAVAASLLVVALLIARQGDSAASSNAAVNDSSSQLSS